MSFVDEQVAAQRPVLSSHDGIYEPPPCSSPDDALDISSVGCGPFPVSLQESREVSEHVGGFLDENVEHCRSKIPDLSVSVG